MPKQNWKILGRYCKIPAFYVSPKIGCDIEKFKANGFEVDKLGEVH